MITARRGPDARIVARRALTYADGGDVHTGRPPHVRAASGLAWQVRDGQRVLVMPQDDTSFLAWLAPPDGEVHALALDYAPGGARVFEKRAGNKQDKLDLECIAALGEREALAFGSGSHENRRRIARITEAGMRLIDAAPLYEALRARADFAGSEMNIEGATIEGSRLLLGNRGNGAPTATLGPLDAIAALPLDAVLAFLDGGPLPRIEAVTPLDLGSVAGARLTLTDLAYDARAGLCFLASAERSPNAYDDGEVVGCAIGALRGDHAALSVLLAEDGAPSRDKPEGLAIVGERGGVLTAYAVVDADDPDVPSALLTIEMPSPR
jgi:hypothetical protein